MNSPRREKADDAFNVLNIEREARAALVRGDCAAVVKILMLGYGERIYSLCLTVLPDRSDADDALQQVFLTAYEHMNTFEVMKYFLPWLRGIAARHCAEILESNGDRNRLFLVSNILPDDPDPRPSGDELLTRKWLVSEVDLCLDEILPQERVMLALRFHEGLSYPQMSEILGVPVSTLKLRVSRLMATMRRSLIARDFCP